MDGRSEGWENLYLKYVNLNKETTYGVQRNFIGPDRYPEGQRIYRRLQSQRRLPGMQEWPIQAHA